MRNRATNDVAPLHDVSLINLIVGAQVPKHPLHFDAAVDILEFGTSERHVMKPQLEETAIAITTIETHRVNALAGVAWTTLHDGCLRFVNQGRREYTGLSDDEANGRNRP